MPLKPIASLLLVITALAAQPAQGQATAKTSGSTKPVATATVWPDEGPRTWAPRPTVPAITANDLRTRLYQLSDDSMMGRKIGELGNYKATEYIAREYKRLGLKPAGDNGTYFQQLDYGPTGFDSATSRLVVAGVALSSKKEWIPMAPEPANGIGGGADLSNVPTVFAGRWGDTTVALDPAMFRGKIAVYLGVPAATGAGAGGGRGGGGARGGGGRGGGQLPRCDSLPDNYGAEAVIANAGRGRGAGGRGGASATTDSTAAGTGAGGTAVAANGRGGRGAGGRGGGRGGRGGAAAAAQSPAEAAGAVAMLMISPDSIPRAAANTAFAGRMGMKPATAPAGGLASATISTAAATKLFGKPVSQLTVGTAGQTVTASWSYAWRMSKTPARNVIAILPGSDPARAAQYVLVSAHNDHNGVNAVAVDHDSVRAYNLVVKPQGANDPACRPSPAQQHRIDSMIAHARSIRPPRRDSIMNGADDDGSGTAVLLEIAERFATEKPARSIIFVSHTGEEAGLLGSKWFTDHPTIPLDSIAAALNMDMVGKGRADQVKLGGPNSIQTLGARRLSRDFGDIIDSVNAVRSEPMAIDRTWDVTANPLNRFCRSDQVNYVHHNVPVTYFSLGYGPDYHQPTDEPQYVDYDHAARLARFIHDIMWAIATRKDRPAITGPDPSYPAC